MRLAPLLVCVLLLVAGCAAAPGPSPPLTTRPLPEKPDTLTRSSVEEYVVAHEEAVLHNRLVREGVYDQVFSSCEIRNSTRKNADYAVKLRCGFVGETFDDSGNVFSVTDGLLVVTYTVNESATVRRKTVAGDGDD